MIPNTYEPKQMMHLILKKLEGSDRRSIGRSEEVVLDVLKNPALFEVLIEGLSLKDPVVRMRAADAMEKASLKHPEYLLPYKNYLLEKALSSKQKEVRWHLAQVLPRLDLSHEENIYLVDVLLMYLTDSSSIVKTLAMQALADIASKDLELCPLIKIHLIELTAKGTSAMKARGKKILAKLND